MFGERDQELNRIILNADEAEPTDEQIRDGHYRDFMEKNFPDKLAVYAPLWEILISVDKKDFFASGERSRKIRDFDNILRRKKLDEKGYFLWYVLNGANLPEKKKIVFDTPDHDIEGFIKNL